MAYGVIEYDKNGLPKCEICSRYFDRVTPHVRQVHNMTAREYKEHFGFDVIKGITSRQSREKSRDAVMRNFDIVIKPNLLERGRETRFNVGHKGRVKEQVSEQTKIMLQKHVKSTPMVEKARETCKNLGKSGLGNQTRWGKK